MREHIKDLGEMVPVKVQEAFLLKDLGENLQNVQGFMHPSAFTPDVDPTYQFDASVTKALLLGFEHNLRVLLQGLHGTGKSTHIEQVATRLNWPCFRLNLDGQISRLDLIGRDAIILKEGKQITSFKEGILPWAVQQPMVLVLDEYDAARPEVMFIIQRLLEKDGVLTLPEQNRVIKPHPKFRLFATANTVGLGDSSGLYHGTYQLNQAQIDRWNMVVRLNYLPEEAEVRVLLAQPHFAQQKDLAEKMVRLAGLSRVGFLAGDVGSVISTRQLILWVENSILLQDLYEAFTLTTINRVAAEDEAVFKEYFLRVFGKLEQPLA